MASDRRREIQTTVTDGSFSFLRHEMCRRCLPRWPLAIKYRSLSTQGGFNDQNSIADQICEMSQRVNQFANPPPPAQPALQACCARAAEIVIIRRVGRRRFGGIREKPRLTLRFWDALGAMGRYGMGSLAAATANCW
jgi:hypothetical protein